MIEHKLKTWPVYFDAIERGEKPFDVRRDDRGFQKGDVLILQRTCEDNVHRVEYDYHGDYILDVGDARGYLASDRPVNVICGASSETEVRRG